MPVNQFCCECGASEPIPVYAVGACPDDSRLEVWTLACGHQFTMTKPPARQKEV